ncbi:MAG: hypothetical protein M3314_10315 [Actinomycetota bacterium]|nr:hypothetical protein [Actinomycetota bacterium]
MLKRIKPFIGRIALLALGLGAAALSVTIDPASAVSGHVVGKFKTDVVFGSDCQEASSQICAIGSTTGNLKGAFTFGVTEFTATNDTPLTSVFRFSGDATVETPGGTLTCKNAAALQTNADQAFVSLCVVTGGTGEWAGASGYLQVRGTFDFTGAATGEYVGNIEQP